jgi:hypothetical protein
VCKKTGVDGSFWLRYGAVLLPYSGLACLLLNVFFDHWGASALGTGLIVGLTTWLCLVRR